MPPYKNGKIGLTFPAINDIPTEDNSDHSSSECAEPPCNKLTPLMSPAASASPMSPCIEPIPSPSGSDDVDCDYELWESAKCLCTSFIFNGNHFGSILQTTNMFQYNEQTISQMLFHLCSAVPQTFDESSMRVDKSLLHQLHPVFRQVFFVVDKDNSI